MNCSTPGLPVHHQLPESTQTHVVEGYWGLIAGIPPHWGKIKMSLLKGKHNIPTGLRESPGEAGKGRDFVSLWLYRPWVQTYWGALLAVDILAH